MGNPENNDIVARFTDELVGVVLSALGSSAVLCVFVGGSAATGEVSCCNVGGECEIYSDVDLYVVVGERVELEGARRRAREAVGGLSLSGNGFRFFRAPDVGVYTFDDLAGQPARPGTVGLGAHNRVLFGDPEIPGRVAARIGGKMSLTEALYLVENRLSELSGVLHAGTGERGGPERFMAFNVCKACLDVGTAALISMGQFAPVRRERVALVRESSVSGQLRERWGQGATGLFERCAQALEKLPSPEWAWGVGGRDTAEAVTAFALAEWKRIASECYPEDADDWSAMILRRCHTGEYVDNLRRFAVMSARRGFSRRGAIVAGIHLSRYSAMDALRLSALMEFLYRDESIKPEIGTLIQTLGPFLERLTRAYGFVSGSLAERSHAMYRAVQ